jgi:hypothetical protein
VVYDMQGRCCLVATSLLVPALSTCLSRKPPKWVDRIFKFFDLSAVAASGFVRLVFWEMFIRGFCIGRWQFDEVL